MAIYKAGPEFLAGLDAHPKPFAQCLGWIENRDAVRAVPGDPPPTENNGTGRPRKASTLESCVPNVEARGIIENVPSEGWATVTWRHRRTGHTMQWSP